MDYRVPADTKEVEKAIGGILTFSQFFWLIGGFVIGLILLALTFFLTKSLFLGLFLTTISTGSAAPFAFYKKHDLTLFEYLKFKKIFKLKNKKIYNINPDKEVTTK